MTSEITSPAANVELVRAAARAFNAYNADQCLARIAPDFIINLAELPEPRHGCDAWRQGFEMMRRAFPDLQAHIEDIVAAQDKVAVAVSATVLRAAVPIEPPTCCMVLTSAEATPESCRATPAVAVLMAGEKIMPKPRPMATSGGTTFTA